MPGLPILKLLVFVCTASLSVYLGFFALDAPAAIQFIKHFVYWIVLATFVSLCAHLYLWLKQQFEEGFVWKKRHTCMAGYILLWSLLILTSQKSTFKILMDEPVLAGTALQMHETKMAMTVSRGLSVGGGFTNLGSYVDKRPYFYPFLVSLLHDWTGYRVLQPLVLNALLVPVFLCFLFVIGQLIWHRHGGYFAVALIGTMPLLAMNANSGGFDFLNLVMLLGTVLATYSYLKKPDALRMNLMILTALLLAQTRYESVLYVIPVGLAALYTWILERKIRLTWTAVMAPLLLVGYLVQRIVINNYESFWQLAPEVDSPFALKFILPNLGHALSFFFATNQDQPNSLLLSVLFVCAMLGLLYYLLTKRVSIELSPGVIVFIGFSVVTCGNFFLLMAYHWGQLDDIVATRIVLPFVLFQLVLVVIFFAYTKAFRHLGAIALCVSIGYFICVSRPLMARSDFLQWGVEQAVVEAIIEKTYTVHGVDALYITDVHLAALITRNSALPIFYALGKKDDLALHMELRTFAPVYLIYQVPGKWSPGAKIKDYSEEIAEHFEIKLIDEVKLNDAVFLRFAEITKVNGVEAPLEHFKQIEDPSSEVAIKAFSKSLP